MSAHRACQPVLCYSCAGKTKQQRFLDLFKQFPNESYRPTADTVDGVLANVTNNQLGPGFTTYDVRDLPNFPTGHPHPYYVTVRDDPAQVIKDLVRNCYTIDGVQTYAKFAKEVVDAKGVRYISEPWTADLWLEAQVSCRARAWQDVSALLTPSRLQGDHTPIGTGWMLRIAAAPTAMPHTHQLLVTPRHDVAAQGGTRGRSHSKQLPLPRAGTGDGPHHLVGVVERWHQLRQGYAP